MPRNTRLKRKRKNIKNKKNTGQIKLIMILYKVYKKNINNYIKKNKEIYKFTNKDKKFKN